jgi:hypothetical protein
MRPSTSDSSEAHHHGRSLFFLQCLAFAYTILPVSPFLLLFLFLIFLNLFFGDRSHVSHLAVAWYLNGQFFFLMLGEIIKGFSMQSKCKGERVDSTGTCARLTSDAEGVAHSSHCLTS